MDELVWHRAENDAGERALARRAHDDEARRAFCGDLEQCLRGALRNERGLGRDACLARPRDRLLHDRRPELLERLLRLLPLVADAAKRRLDGVHDDERVAEPDRQLDRSLHGDVRALRAVDADDDRPAHDGAFPVATCGSTASNAFRPKNRSFPPKRQTTSNTSPSSRKPMPITNGTPMPRIVWPVYEFSTS